MLEIVAIPAFADNYIWLVRDDASGETAVVDPGDAAPALAEAKRRGWRVTQVWNTHHHWDHSGGNLAMKEATGCTVSGPAAENAFVGDTLFAMGCGRLFEGTPQQMYSSLRRIAELPADTALYCGHEYTLANARFAAHAEPNNQAIGARLEEVQAMREAGKITLPTSVAQERETNPFVRATNAEEFARLRAEKDSFRS